MEEKLISSRIKVLVVLTEYQYHGIEHRSFTVHCCSNISEFINHQQWLRINCWKEADKALRYYVFSVEIDNPKSNYMGYNDLNWAASMLSGPGNNLSGISEVELVDKMKTTICYLSKSSSCKSVDLTLKWEGDEG